MTTALVAVSHDSDASELRDQIEMGNAARRRRRLRRRVKSRDRFVTATWILGGAAVAAGGSVRFLLVFDMPTADSSHRRATGRF